MTVIILLMVEPVINPDNARPGGWFIPNETEIRVEVEE